MHRWILTICELQFYYSVYRLLKEKRRAEQKRNVERKKKAEKKDSKESGTENEDESDDDRKWYREEVGEEPDESKLNYFCQM